MCRLKRIRVQYLAAIALAVGIGGGIYALRGSQTNAAAPAAAPLVAPVTVASTAAPTSPVPRTSTPARPSTVARVPTPRWTPTPAQVAPEPNGVPSVPALLARVHSGYANVPAIVVTGNLVRARLRLTFILHDDTIVAEAWVGTGANGQVIGAVARAGSPTFARELGTNCWRPLAASDVPSLTGIGTPFPPVASRTFVGTPARSRDGWVISGEDSNGARTMFVIDAKTFGLRSMTSSENGLSFTGTINALSSVPALPVPEPRC